MFHLGNYLSKDMAGTCSLHGIPSDSHGVSLAVCQDSLLVLPARPLVDALSDPGPARPAPLQSG